jgi:ubiquinone/menaquinone biosynthesis C-methylase UbiE
MTAQLDERTPTGDESLSVNPAETYEQYMVPPLFAPSAAHLLAVAQMRPGERALDVGTGTGIVARLAAAQIGPGGSVTALDPSPGMLAVARDKGTREGVAVDWVEGTAETLPFPDQHFDLALSQYALMFFTDKARALAEMRRVLVRGGRVALQVFQSIDRHPFYQTLDQAISHRLGASAVGDIFALGDAAGLRNSLTRAGFQDVVVEPFQVTARFPNPEAFLAGEIDVDTAAIPAMQQLDPAARRDLVAALQSDMAEPLRAVTNGTRVELTFHTLVAQARR